MMALFLTSRSRQELKSTILGLIGWIPLGWILFPIFIPLFILYLIVHKIAKLLRPDLIPLSKVDSFLAYAPSSSPHSYVYTCQIWDVKGEVDVGEFRSLFQNQFLANLEDRKKYVNFYCYFVNFLGYTFKKKAKMLDLNYHIQKLELEEGQSIEQFLGKWMVQHDIDPSGESRPDWSVKIIPKSDSNTTVILKLHHGLCDGYTMVNLVGKLSGEKAPYMFREPVPSKLKLLRCLAQFPYLLSVYWSEMASNAKNSLVSHLPPTPNGGEEWLISFCTLDLQTVKQIRSVTGTSFVTVLASIQIGALKRLMLELSEDKHQDFFRELEETHVGHSMGWPKHPVMTGETGMANHLTLNSMKAPFKTDDPLERLLHLDKDFRSTKTKGYPVISYYGALNLLNICPSWLRIKLFTADLSVVGMESAISTLLCSPNKHHLLGRPVEHLYLPVLALSPFPKIKLMMVPASHSGILDVSVNASTALVKNQEMLERLTKIYLPHELEELRKRTGNIVD